MKKLILFLVATLFAIACSAKSKTEDISKPMITANKPLVVYFSATGTTKQVASNLAKALNSDIYEIKPLVPYTSKDLDWTNKTSRSSLEMDNKNSRPEIAEDDFSVKDYDTVFLGFPIWWGTAPRIVQTFLEKQDFSNKTIIIFATSGSSGLGKTDQDLKPSVSDSAKIIKGKILNHNPSIDELTKWIETFK